MADEDERQESSASAGGVGVDPAAIAVSLGRPGTLDPRAAVFLEKQARLVDLQIVNLEKLDEYETSHLRWRRFNDRMRGAWQILLVIVGSAVVAVIVAAVWNASQSEGLVVDSFSVPAQFAQAGMTGDVIAQDMTDRVAAVRDTANANSIAHSNDVRLDSDEQIKIAIPDTGVSLGEVERYLRSWLGYERHLAGNVRILDGGKIALTVALSGADAQTFTGTDLAALEQQAAEHVFQSVDPSNYVLYLMGANRTNDVLPAIQHLIAIADNPGMLSDGYSLWGNWTRNQTGDLPLAMKRLRVSASIAPAALPPHMEMMFTADDMGHDEEALREARLMPRFRQKDQYAWREGSGFGFVQEWGMVEADVLTGDFSGAASAPCGGCSFAEGLFGRAEYLARAHDVAGSRALIDRASASNGVSETDAARARVFVDAAAGDWPAAVADARAYDAAMTRTKSRKDEIVAQTAAASLLAEALARNGDLSGAHDAIDKTPTDCVTCDTARADIYAAERDWRDAARWFARAVNLAPSVPFADTDWGEMLLRRGQFDDAIAKFASAHRKGPHFADPLEMWGEALIAKNRSDLALAKFEDAAKYAPNWGRLHLKWGEALSYLGRKEEAATQFALAHSLGETKS